MSAGGTKRQYRNKHKRVFTHDYGTSPMKKLESEYMNQPASGFKQIELPKLRDRDRS